MIGGPGADGLYGDDGVDTADYSGGGAVTVTIDNQANDGVAGEQDDVRQSTENLLGGRFGDHLTGSNVANAIDGGLGPDELTGSGGPDVLTGGPGADTMSGGGGADTLKAKDGTADDVTCGADPDTVFADLALDTLAADCE
jgi:Ca2+-binding RTX toxin-like protein